MTDIFSSKKDTVLKDLEARKLGRFAPPPTSSSSTQTTSHTRKPDQKEGARCIVLSPTPSDVLNVNVDSNAGSTGTDSGQKQDGTEKRGTIRFVGETNFGDAKGDWIGIELDEPVGKNDGRSVGVFAHRRHVRD